MAHLCSLAFFLLPPPLPLLLLLGPSRTCPSHQGPGHTSAVWHPPGFPDHGPSRLEPTGPGRSRTSRLSSKTLLAPPPPGGKGWEARPASPPPWLPLPREGKCQIPCLSGGGRRVGGGVIQPQECRVRRAFPAITRRGRGWRANGFNYHSDRNAGQLAPSQLVPGTPTLYPAQAKGVGRQLAGHRRAVGTPWEWQSCPGSWVQRPRSGSGVGCFECERSWHRARQGREPGVDTQAWDAATSQLSRVTPGSPGPLPSSAWCVLSYTQCMVCGT